MEYSIESWSLEKLIDTYQNGKLNLNPPYQRNDIWSSPSKRKLIDTILKGFPLPAFFLHEKDNGYDMVDGQQRTRTILGYKQGLFKDLNNKKFTDINPEPFFKYQIPVIIIEHLNDEASVEDFYYRVNKFGSKLNRPEILKAQYFDTPFQNLIEEISQLDSFLKLDIFTESTKNRMQDFDFIGELLSLIKFGITEKKTSVEKLFTNLDASEIVPLKNEFENIIDLINDLNIDYPIKNTRYRQRNDFYTLFSFLHKHNEINSSALSEMYKILVQIGPEISPSSTCFSFQDYATNCVSQSNSKNAREQRLTFFEHLLLNTDPAPIKNEEEEITNEIIVDVLEFYDLNNDDLKSVDQYYLISSEKLSQKTEVVI